MASENATLLLPAHGEALTDPALIQENLTVLAEALEWVIAQTKKELNNGTRQDLVYRALDVPDHLLTHPTLNQQYVSWEDISKMVMRRYVGWWDDTLAFEDASRSTHRQRRSPSFPGALRPSIAGRER